MSTEEKDRIIGRLVTEHQEASRHAHIARERLHELGHSMLTIATQLAQDQFDVAETNLRSFREDLVDLSAVEALVQEQRAATEHVRHLAGRLADLGVNI